MHHLFCRRAIGLGLCAVGAFALPAIGQTFTPPPNSNIVDVLTLGAIPNDGLDDLAAFQAALNATVNTSRIVYVPNGTYTFSGRLNWGGVGSGGFFTLQGQSQAGVILRLNDNAAGFGDPANPRVFVDAYEGNTANQFRNYLRDVTIDTGAGNTGAIGLEFQANNTGRIENVTIRSSDPQKRGVTGLNQGFNFPGPLLIRNLTIDGFDTGYVGAPQEYSVVFENLMLRNQRVLGMYVWRLPLQIRNLVSQNSVPVLRSDTNPGAWGHVVIDGGTFTGGAPGGDSIINENSGGVLVLRNVTTSGYANAVRDKSFSVATPILVPGGVVSQYTTDAPASLNPSPTVILNLPVEETPDAPVIPVAQWVSVKSFGAIENDNLDDTAAIQAAMDSGAPVVYFPSGRYFISQTIRVGPGVRRVEGLMSELTINVPLANEGGAQFLVPPGSQNVVHFSGLNGSFSGPGGVNGVFLEHATANTVVVRDGDISYRNSVSGGKVFLENVVGTNMTFTGQRVWARQLNPEGSTVTHIINDGGDLYVLGLKTEGSSTVLDNRNRARATIMGGLVYPATAITDRTRPMVINNESALSFSMPESAYVDPNNAYAVWVRETRSGVTTNFTRAMLPLGRGHSDLGGQIALYNGYQTDASLPSTPGTPVLGTQTLNSYTITWAAATDAQSGIARYNVYRGGAFYRSVMTPSLTETDLPDNTGFAYRVTAVNGAGLESGQSGVFAATTLRDQTPPRLLGARTGLDPRYVMLQSTEALATASAQRAENYAISGPSGVTVLGAALSTDGRTVTLTTTPMAPGPHTLSISGVTDRASSPNAIAPGSRAAFMYASSSATPGTGLTARYYANRDLVGAPVLTRIDPAVNFVYGLGSPDPLVPVDNFSARWSGRLQPKFTEPYTLFIRSDDGTRLFIDGVAVVSNWADQAPTERSVTMMLDSSRTYDLVLDYYESGFGAEVQLSWQSPSQPKQVIPQSALYPNPQLTDLRTTMGAGADIDLSRTSPVEGTGQSMGAFHSPAQGAFHQAAYWRIDLSSLNLASNYVVSAVGNLSQTFFGIGDGRRQINIFGVQQSAGGDNWIESGAGFVTWQTAIGNDDSGGSANPATSQWLSTYLLDNTGFQNNNQADKLSFGGARLLEFINQDTDNRLTFLAKRVDASNEGQSWFTREWGLPAFAPALKIELAPRCPQIISQPLALAGTSSQALTLSAVVRGAPPLAYQWRRNAIAVADGAGGASVQGGTVIGASGVVEASGWVSLTIAGAQASDAGTYSLVVTNACGNVTSSGAALTIVPGACNPADVCGAGATYADGTVDVGPDGQLTIEDFLVFLSAFGDGTGCPGAGPVVSPCNPADICGIGATYDAGAVDIGPDGDLTIEDFLNFLSAFGDGAGCP